MRNWWILIQERFSPVAYVPMILVFSWANGLYLANAAHYTFETSKYVLTALLMLSFFFRMRCFDEIKDYDVDLKINPTRPLARGILSVAQVKKGLFVMILFELLLSAYLGFWPFVIHTIAIFYSLMMYEEFFVGDLLRPHLTTYAVTHTFVSVLLGISAATAITGFNLQKLTFADACFFLMNWAFFNLFEFARKTFAPSEERPNVPSYSNIFKPLGAWLLSWSQVFVGIVLAYFALSNSSRFYWLAAAGVVYTLMTLGYALKPQAKMAKIFRDVTGIYLLVHYVLLSLVIGA
ncbi:manganese transporter permease [Bdellovibrio sp. HCB337]|uniref:manganese transporter permease n=1 Tax=Bdellovibrio sp. HCB337 TaxID=3394358 RepID=UPI0039A46F7A